MFELWPEHVDAIEVFVRCDTQWTVLVGMGVLHHEGLNYERVASVARDWCGLKLSAKLLDQIRWLEDEAKGILNRS